MAPIIPSKLFKMRTETKILNCGGSRQSTKQQQQQQRQQTATNGPILKQTHQRTTKQANEPNSVLALCASVSACTNMWQTGNCC